MEVLYILLGVVTKVWTGEGGVTASWADAGWEAEL